MLHAVSMEAHFCPEKREIHKGFVVISIRILMLSPNNETTFRL